MHIESIILLVIVVVGGAEVLASYVLGLRGSSGGSNALWGGVPARVRPAYVVSMVLSVVGYFAVLYYLFFKLVPGEVVIGGRLGFALFYPILLLILVPSALWMPLTSRYLKDPGTGRWIAVRSVLFIVGLASIALVWALFALEPRQNGAAYWLAVAGSGYFALHTFILDAILWAALSKRRA